MMTYDFLRTDAELLEAYHKFQADGSLWAFCHAIDPDQWSEPRWLAICHEKDVALLAGFIDGELAGVMTMKPAAQPSMSLEIGVAAFRPFYPQAETLCRGGFLWVLDNFSPAPTSFIGWIPALNRHSLRMMSSLGFAEQARVPGLLWYTRRQSFVDGVLVMATPDSIRATIKE